MANSDKRMTNLERRRKRLEPHLLEAKSKIRTLQGARIYLGLVFALALLIGAMKPEWHLGLPAFIIFIPVFTVLVMKSRAWNAYHLKLQRLDAFFARQYARSAGFAPEMSEQHLLGDETFGSDLGFFGPYSLWTLLDETITDEGSHELKSWLISPPLPPDRIQARQKDVQALRKEAWFYTRLTLIGDRSELRLSTKQVLEFVAHEVVPAWYAKAYVGVIAIWFAWIASVTIDHPDLAKLRLPLFGVFAFFHLGLLFKAGPVFKKGEGVSHHLSLLAPIFTAVEKRTEKSEELRFLCPTIHVQGPSKHARRIARIVGALGTEANPIIHLLLNAIFPWATTGALALEYRRKKLGQAFAACLRELAQVEALFSLVILDKYQTQVYPTLDSKSISGRGLFHPLIDRKRVVPNDFEFSNGKTLGLLTGSNMSGKSTFLRTIGVNQALANMGAPVFAESLATQPLKIESCIEVSDSLRDGFSYFYAEVRRLKHLLEATKTGQSLFLIDEIFRGTNNRERQIGSRAVIRALAKAPGTQGFISTHDLELTHLEETEPTVLNLHFREFIEDGKMAFSYKLQRGASPTTNALRIMALEGLPVDANET